MVGNHNPGLDIFMSVIKLIIYCIVNCLNYHKDTMNQKKNLWLIVF